MNIVQSTFIETELRAELEIQLELRNVLEAELERIREISNLYIAHQSKLVEEMINIYSRIKTLLEDKVNIKIKNNHPLDEVILRKAIKLGIEFHSKGKEIARESGDPYIVHPLQTGEVLAFMGEDTKTVAGGILHDSIENNYENRVEVMNKIYKNLGEEVLLLVMSVTAKPIDDSVLKKKLLNLQIQERSCFFLNEKLYKIRYADRLTNLLTLNGLKSKNGISADERREKIISDTRTSLLRKSEEIDKKFKPILKLHTYMKDIINLHQSSNVDTQYCECRT